MNKRQRKKALKYNLNSDYMYLGYDDGGGIDCAVMVAIRPIKQEDGGIVAKVVYTEILDKPLDNN